MNIKRDAVDGTHLTVHAKIACAIVRLQVLDTKDGRPGHRTPLPMRANRLRGSMYSFIETARRNRPTKVITTRPTGNAIHHQIPATIAVCWLAQYIMLPMVGVSMFMNPSTASVTSSPIDQFMLF